MKDERTKKENAYRLMQRESKQCDTIQKELVKLKESKVGFNTRFTDSFSFYHSFFHLNFFHFILIYFIFTHFNLIYFIFIFLGGATASTETASTDNGKHEKRTTSKIILNEKN